MQCNITIFNYRNWIHYNAVLVFKKNSYSKNINQRKNGAKVLIWTHVDDSKKFTQCLHARNEQNLTKLNPKMDEVFRLCWVT